MNQSPSLDSLSRGFRQNYLSYAQMTEQLRAWAEAFPEFVQLESIGKSREDRELWLLVIGRNPERTRPAVWVDGNMHASEVCGSSVALSIAEDVIRWHLEPETSLHGLPAHVGEAVRDVLFYVLPRMSPDGAECVLQTGRYLRSVPRDERPNRQHARWISEDLDGDGLCLVMRQEDSGGEYVAASEFPGLLLPRRITDQGPYYKLFPEGRIENFDGHTVPTPNFLSDNQTDLNRNFPWSWAPEHDQFGAGAFPGSEPESRAVVEFTSARPHIYAWLNLHTFGGVLIRPLGNQPDSKMDPSDLALYRQIGAWTEEHTGYPSVSGFEEFTYEPEKPLRGDLSDYAYHQRGCVAYVIELWDLFRQIGMDPKQRFVDHYSHLSREDLISLARWDAEHNESRAIRPWRKVNHPQLGPVEVGGIDPRVGLWNPPYDRIAGVCEGQSAAFLRVAATAPRIGIRDACVEGLGEDLFRVSVVVENRGYLPTYVLSSARKLDWNEPLHAELVTEDCTLQDPYERRQPVGHLDGWGRGLFDGSSALYYMRSTGNAGAKKLSWTVKGRGEIKVLVGSCRVGWSEHLVVSKKD